MTRYLVSRLLQSVLVVIGIMVATFLLLRLVPGDPARVILGYHATPKSLANVRHQLGLSGSVWSQFTHYALGVVQGNWGTSFSQHLPVLTVIGAAFVPSMLLVVYTVAIAIVIAVPLAVLSAYRENKPVDHGVRLGSMVALGMPSFWVGLVLVIILSLRVGAFPVAGYASGFAGHMRSLTLPALTLAIAIAPLFLRTLRATVIDTRRTDFVEAAQARGLGPSRVMMRYVLRNSLAATITMVAATIALLLSGTVIVENIFSIPGLGSLLVGAVNARDYPLVQGLVLIFAGAVVLMNLVADLTYTLLDPRVRL